MHSHAAGLAQQGTVVLERTCAMASANLRVPDRAMVPRLLSMSSRVMPTPVSLPQVCCHERQQKTLASRHVRSPHAQSMIVTWSQHQRSIKSKIEKTKKV